MVTITTGNSYSKITGLTPEAFSHLRKELSYEADNAGAFFGGGNYNRVRYCIDKTGVFATGLKSRVLSFLTKHKIELGLLDISGHQVPARKVNHGYKAAHAPHQWQEDAAAYIARFGRGIVSAPTGSGKSMVAALVTARLNVRTLIVVPSLQIKQQLTLALMDVFSDMSNITVENIDSSALKTATAYDLLIIDEAHHVASKTYHKLNKTAWKGIYYRCFLSATPFRNQTEETMLFEGIAGTAKFTLTYQDAVSKGYICPVEAYYVEVPKQPTEAFTWQKVYSELVVNHDVKNAIIADLTTTLLESGETGILCLVKEIKHGEALARFTGFPFINGQDDETRPLIDQFSAGQIPVVIATEGVMAEGVDSRACSWVIIAGLGKAKSSFMQKVGRCVRRYPGKETGKVIILKDRSHKFLLRHFNAQKQILLDEYGVKVLKLEL